MRRDRLLAERSAGARADVSEPAAKRAVGSCAHATVSSLIARWGQDRLTGGREIGGPPSFPRLSRSWAPSPRVAFLWGLRPGGRRWCRSYRTKLCPYAPQHSDAATADTDQPRWHRSAN